LRNKARKEMGNKHNTSKKEKGKTRLMIVDITWRIAKLSLYHLKLKNVDDGLGVTSATRSPARCDTNHIGDG